MRNTVYTQQRDRMNTTRWARSIGLVLLLSALSAGRAQAQEYQLKAAFLYNFAKQIEWPADAFAAADAPVQVCIFSGDAIAGAVQSLDGKAANNRKIALKTLTRVEDARLCHMIFLAETQSVTLEKVQAALGAAPVLTVGEQPGFTQSGGVMSLIKSSNKIHVKLNIKAAQQARLKLSPQILKLASGE